MHASRKRTILAICLVLAMLAGLFPPYQARTLTLIREEIVESVGHHSIFGPPPTERVGSTLRTYRVDLPRLALIWLIIALAGAAVVVPTASKYKRHKPNDGTLVGIIPHIAYEAAALELCTRGLTSWPRPTLEAALLHARNLRDFFWPTDDQLSRYSDKAIMAADYFADAESWNKLAGQLPKPLAETRKALNAQLVHLSSDRVVEKRIKGFERELPTLTPILLDHWALFRDALNGTHWGDLFEEAEKAKRAELGLP